MFLLVLTDHMKSVEGKLSELDKEGALLKAELEALNEKRQKLEPFLKRQAREGIDANRVIKERTMLAAELKQVQVERAQVEADLKIKEARCMEDRQRLNLLVAEYNRVLELHDL